MLLCQTPEAFDAELQVLLGTRQDSWVLEHDFQPDLDTHLILTEKSFTRDNCKLAKYSFALVLAMPSDLTDK